MDLLQKVESALDSIRPYLEADGGNVSVEEITSDNIVKLKLSQFHAWFEILANLKVILFHNLYVE